MITRTKNRIYAMTENRIAEFWSRVDVRGSDKCWNYKRCKDTNGYGQFRINGDATGAHRIAYYLTKGKIPKNKHVLHKCDNKACCNPDHLFCGTHFDNMIDAIVKGKAGMMPKLYAGEVWLIRRLKNIKTKDIGRYNSPAEFVAAMFKVSHTTIRNVWRYKRYLCREGFYV